MRWRNSKRKKSVEAHGGVGDTPTGLVRKSLMQGDYTSNKVPAKAGNKR